MKTTSKIGLALLGVLVLIGLVLSLDVARDLFAQEPEAASAESDTTTAASRFRLRLVPRQVLSNVLTDAVTAGDLSQDQADQIADAVDEQSADIAPHLAFRLGQAVGSAQSNRPNAPHLVGGTLHALRQAVVDGVLTSDEAAAIANATLSQIDGLATVVIPDFNLAAPLRFRLQLLDGGELDEAVWLDAFQTALDDAVANGVLSATEAADLHAAAADFEAPVGPFGRGPFGGGRGGVGPQGGRGPLR